jgi:hypothetical protein
MSDLFEFISKEYSFREINFRGVQLLGVAQEHNFHWPVSRPLALDVDEKLNAYVFIFMIMSR